MPLWLGTVLVCWCPWCFFVFGSAKIHTIGRLESVISQKCGFVWDINVLNNAKSNFVLFLLSCIDEKCLFLSEFSRINQ